MKITFRINYRTRWGESLCLSGSVAKLGGGDLKKAVAMKMTGPESWETTIDLPQNTADFEYRYIVKRENNAPWRFEWGAPHRFTKGPKEAKNYILLDSWQEIPPNKPFYSSAFTDGILSRKEKEKTLGLKAGSLVIKVFAPMLLPSQTLAISGSNTLLGSWDAGKVLRMNSANFPEWNIELPLDRLEIPFNFKFVILDSKSGAISMWETGNNRMFDTLPASADCIIEYSGLRFCNAPTSWKGAGTAIPVFSLRSEEDFGCGDFLDIIKMVDWCAMTGQKILQLLPVNDTTMTGTWTDSYPYNGNSTFALHPMYIRPEAVAKLKDAGERARFDKLRKKLNESPTVDYEAVNKAKEEYMRALYAQERQSLARKKDFKAFVESNSEWLRPYAAFRLLRDRYNTPDMSKWEEYAVYDENRIDALCKAEGEETGYHYFVQYHLDRQLRQARDYAHSKGIVLKGDIPIGISRTSVDAWVYPRIFNLSSQAGAPPDDFSVLGQNWGFPTYNWDEMARDGFSWWKARFRKMQEYFDAYRIDHILGFFRIWQIPIDTLHGLLGVFNPALPFSPEEIRDQYGFNLNIEIQTHPLIMQWMLGDFFGPYAEEAKALFLEPVDSERFRLREFVNTQRKVADYFAGQEKNEKNNRICNALLGLIDDVLFIEDPVEKGKYHPRISAQFTYQYRRLDDYGKWCFDRLYNDFFYRRHNEFWKGKAMWKLPPLLGSTSMLACAEDLGMIPDCVPSVMRELQILSLEIQRMPKDSNVEFANTFCYPYYSVCTTSTHDMPGIRAWWEEDRGRSQRYFENVLGQQGAAPYFADPWVCSLIINLQLASPSMLCIIPLQDWLSTDGSLRRQNPQEEQINEPSNPRHYWRYRMHITIENLLSKTDFNSDLKSRITSSGR